jgi:hypothetical protein
MSITLLLSNTILIFLPLFYAFSSLSKYSVLILSTVWFNSFLFVARIFIPRQYFHVSWVPCHHGMARPQVADGGDALQFWKAAANILNKQPRTADKGWSSSLGVGCGANNSP